MKEVKYKLIRNYPEYPVTKWAAVLEVSTSVYYDWLKQKQLRDQKEQEYIAIIKEIFEESQNTYGIGRMCGCLREHGYTASYKRVTQIIKRLGLALIHR